MRYWILNTFFANNHFLHFLHSQLPLISRSAKKVPSQGMLYHLPDFFTRIILLAMYTRVYIYYINILLKRVSKRHQLDQEGGIYQLPRDTQFDYFSNETR
ncbi:MAG: hypothetical protein [Circular genetic element sp.]|nr:MAG: hypothetical protein [Circular genetic element sp.]